MERNTAQLSDSNIPSITFSCNSCDFVMDCHYKGTQPPFAKQFILHEDCFVMKDPFSTTGGFISVGAVCSQCKESVCMATSCSFFYTQRFCIKCASDNIMEFPQELQKEILKMKDKNDG